MTTSNKISLIDTEHSVRVSENYWYAGLRRRYNVSDYYYSLLTGIKIDGGSNNGGKFLEKYINELFLGR